MKLFKTGDIHVVAECQELFGFDLPSVQLARRRKKFLEKFEHYRESLLIPPSHSCLRCLQRMSGVV